MGNWYWGRGRGFSSANSTDLGAGKFSSGSWLRIKHEDSKNSKATKSNSHHQNSRGMGLDQFSKNADCGLAHADQISLRGLRALRVFVFSLLLIHAVAPQSDPSAPP